MKAVDIEDRYNKLYKATKRYMEKDKSIDALIFRMHFGMMTKEDSESFMSDNFDEIETPWGTVNIRKHNKFVK